jgi:enoyl-[acyl-carrier-protein] reductase (NADH)
VTKAEGDREMEGLMQGKRGLIMGIANDHSIAWGMAKTLHAQGAELAFTFQGEALGKRVKPLARSTSCAKSGAGSTSSSTRLVSPTRTS